MIVNTAAHPDPNDPVSRPRDTMRQLRARGGTGKRSVSLDFPAPRRARPTGRAGIVLAYDTRELEREAGIMRTTLLELVTAVNEVAESEDEVIATVVH